MAKKIIFLIFLFLVFSLTAVYAQKKEITLKAGKDSYSTDKFYLVVDDVGNNGCKIKVYDGPPGFREYGLTSTDRTAWVDVGDRAVIYYRAEVEVKNINEKTRECRLIVDDKKNALFKRLDGLLPFEKKISYTIGVNRHDYIPSANFKIDAIKKSNNEFVIQFYFSKFGDDSPGIGERVFLSASSDDHYTTFGDMKMWQRGADNRWVEIKEKEWVEKFFESFYSGLMDFIGLGIPSLYALAADALGLAPKAEPQFARLSSFSDQNLYDVTNALLLISQDKDLKVELPVFIENSESQDVNLTIFQMFEFGGIQHISWQRLYRLALGSNPNASPVYHDINLVADESSEGKVFLSKDYNCNTPPCISNFEVKGHKDIPFRTKQQLEVLFNIKEDNVIWTMYANNRYIARRWYVLAVYDDKYGVVEDPPKLLWQDKQGKWKELKRNDNLNSIFAFIKRVESKVAKIILSKEIGKIKVTLLSLFQIILESVVNANYRDPANLENYPHFSDEKYDVQFMEIPIIDIFPMLPTKIKFILPIGFNKADKYPIYVNIFAINHPETNPELRFLQTEPVEINVTGREVKEEEELTQASQPPAISTDEISKEQNATDTKPLISTKNIAKSIVFIIDTSGSMNSKSSETGNPKIDDAKQALQVMINEIKKHPSKDEYALMTYNDCGSTPIQQEFTSNLDTIQSIIPQLTAAGNTPMTLSLQNAASYIWDNGKGKVGRIILLSDGQENCGGDPVDAASTIRTKSIGVPTKSSTTSFFFIPFIEQFAYAGVGDIFKEIIIDVIGFGIVPNSPEEAQLQKTAEAGGGKYYTAATVEELTKALTTAATGLPISGAGLIPATFPKSPSWMIILMYCMIISVILLSVAIIIIIKAKYKRM